MPALRLYSTIWSMGMGISTTNVLSARNALNRNQAFQQNVFLRLATGKKINSGKDDPAGLIASETLAAEIRALEAESRALQRADSNARISEGHGQEFSSLLIDLEGLVVASANTAGMSDAEIAANQMQIDSAVASIQRIHGDVTSSLDGINIPNGGNAAVQTSYDDALAAALSVVSGGANDLSSGNFAAAQTALHDATLDVATGRGRVGGFQKDVIGPRLRSAQVAIENITESRSRIVDTNYAVEMSNLFKVNVLITAGIKVLGIAQQQQATVLSLLS